MIEKIKELDLHDSPVNKININFAEDKIQLELASFIEEKENYSEISLIFHNVVNIKLPTTDNLTVESLYDIKIIDKINKYYATIVFLLGFGRPSYSIEFEFSLVEIKK